MAINYFMKNNDLCPICKNVYKEDDKKIVYHVTYRPEVITDSCRGCNYAEYLIRRPEITPTYFMENRKSLVKEWTLRNRPLIN